MSKENKFEKNVIIFSAMTVLTKLITFFMLPLYTNFLTTEEYGIISIITTISELVLPIVTLCAHDGLFRYLFDKRYEKKEVWKVSEFMFFRGMVICIVGSIILHVFIKIKVEYIIFLNLLVLFSGVFQLLSFYCRGIDKTRIMLETSIVYSFLNCLFCVLFVAKLELGITGYFISSILAYGVSIVVGSFRCRVPIGIGMGYEKTLLREIQRYSIPLIFSSLGWWIGNFVDRYVVTFFIGDSANGVYSVSYRIPTILSLVGMVMNRAWTISALDEDDLSENSFVSELWEKYQVIMILVASGVMFINIPLAKVLYAKAFFQAWKYTSPLVGAALFVSLTNFYDAVFQKEKDTKTSAKISIAVAISNIILSICLVGKFGVMGVAIGTLISNYLGYIMKKKMALKYVCIKERRMKNIICYFLLILQGVIGQIGWNASVVICELIIIGGIIVVQQDVIYNIIKKDVLLFAGRKKKR